MISKSDLIEQLKELHDTDDPESAHYEAEQLLLAFIDDEEVTKAFGAVPKWYA